MSQIRPAAVAGTFYPGSAAELTTMIRRLLKEAGDKAEDGPISTAAHKAPPTASPTAPPKAIIAPHAGYIYSGPIAASVYARLKPLRGQIERVVLLGPCHRVSVQGLALSGADFFETPLGTIPLDKAAERMIIDMPQVCVFDASHAKEHSLEVHLPFLQEVLGSFQLLPLAVGNATPDEVAEVLDRLWGGPETLIVVSSDLSHYLDYDTACELDRKTSQAIEAFDHTLINRDQACGRIPVGGLLELAKRRNLNIATVDLRNSGDTAGSRDQVVGYGAWMLNEQPNTHAHSNDTSAHKIPGESAYRQFAAQTRALLDQHGETLLHVAAASIEFGLEYDKPSPVDATHYDAELQAHGASFVTLKKSDRLRGCVGSSQAYRSLIIDTAENAFSAAFKDPRFEPLNATELDDLSLSISVLSPSSPMGFDDEADLLHQLQPGTDGLIITEGKKRALFLPVVWESLTTPADFLAQLKVKAGLAKDYWSESIEARRFVTEQISSQDLLNPALIWRSHPLI